MTAPVQYAIRGTSARAVAADVEAAVAGGLLPSGQRLPAVRTLAARLDLSPTTVAAAYRTLRERGIVRSAERSGVVVSDRSPFVATRGSVPTGVRDLATGNPDPALLPPLAPALRRLRPAVRLYDEPPMTPVLAAALAADLAACGLPPSAVTATSGAMDGVERVLVAHLRPGDAVAVEDPGYPGVLDLVRALGLRTVPVAVDDEGLRPAPLRSALAAGAVAVVTTPVAQNPTGAALTPGRAAALREVLDPHPDVLVVEDDHYGALATAPVPHLVTERTRWAVVRSVAKALGPDLRVAALAGDADTVARVEARMGLGAGWVSGVLQDLVGVLLGDPGTAAAVAGAGGAYDMRRSALRDALAGVGIAATGATGFNVWVPVADEAAVVAGLLAAGWAVRAGGPYRAAAGPAIRITAATLIPGEAAELATAVARALRPARRTRSA